MGRWYMQGRYTEQKNDSHPWQDPAGGHRRTWDFITLVRAAKRHALQNLWIVYFWNFLFNTLCFIWLRVTETAGKEGLLYFVCWGKKYLLYLTNVSTRGQLKGWFLFSALLSLWNPITWNNAFFEHSWLSWDKGSLGKKNNKRKKWILLSLNQGNETKHTNECKHIKDIQLKIISTSPGCRRKHCFTWQGSVSALRFLVSCKICDCISTDL